MVVYKPHQNYADMDLGLLNLSSETFLSHVVLSWRGSNSFKVSSENHIRREESLWQVLTEGVYTPKEVVTERKTHKELQT